MVGYKKPDTSDKLPDENWIEYWDRKRHELHGENCGCAICFNEDEIKAMIERDPGLRRVRNFIIRGELP